MIIDFSVILCSHSNPKQIEIKIKLLISKCEAFVGRRGETGAGSGDRDAPPRSVCCPCDEVPSPVPALERSAVKWGSKGWPDRLPGAAAVPQA